MDKNCQGQILFVGEGIFQKLEVRDVWKGHVHHFTSLLLVRCVRFVPFVSLAIVLLRDLVESLPEIMRFRELSNTKVLQFG